MAVIGDEPVPTSSVADELGRKPSSLSPSRDGLIKKGLIYSSERGPDRVHRPPLRQISQVPACLIPSNSKTKVKVKPDKGLVRGKISRGAPSEGREEIPPRPTPSLRGRGETPRRNADGLGLPSGG